VKKNRKCNKRFLFIISAVFIVLLLSPFPSSPRYIIDLETGLPAEEVELICPFIAQMAAPFFDLPFYFLTLQQPKNQLMSWFLWLAISWLIFSFFKIRGTPVKRVYSFLRGLVVIAVSFTFFIIYCILFPPPQCRLKGTNPDEIFMDLHSHTLYSHDGLVTSERSLKWHLEAGFHAWAVTEHDWIGGSPAIQREMLMKKDIDALVIPGMEISFQDVHLNLLGIEKCFNISGYKSIGELVKAVHLQEGAVILPHFWTERKSPFSMEDLSAAGVDGFEIAGSASVPLAPEVQKDIVSFCRRKGVAMVSGTNWHGWRNFCGSWTGFNAPGWKQMDCESREKMVINALRKRNNTDFRVVGYAVRLPSTASQFFEPFTGFLRYFFSLTIWQKLSWIFWAVIIYFFFKHVKNRRRLSIFLWFFITAVLLAKSSSIYAVWGTVGAINEILPEVSEFLMAAAAVTFLLGVTNLGKKELRHI